MSAVDLFLTTSDVNGEGEFLTPGELLRLHGLVRDGLLVGLQALARCEHTPDMRLRILRAINAARILRQGLGK